MKLGFYYHIVGHIDGDNIWFPGYIGLFIDSIAEEVEELVLLFHNSEKKENSQDYTLQKENIRLVSLGRPEAAWKRSFFHKKYLNKVKTIEADAWLLRSPTPFGPYFHKYVDVDRLFYFVVGNYNEGQKFFKIRSIRDLFIKLYIKHNHTLFERQLKNQNILVNSPQLFDRYKETARSINLVKTTTLLDNSFFDREDTCEKDVVKILYTGRIDFAKGLVELTLAFSEVRKKLKDKKLELHFVGWESGERAVCTQKLQKLVKTQAIENCVFFHGKKKVGEELNAMYKMADIYAIPSHHEGFPRTIWEAMSQGLPVIATTVGAIPYYLTDEQNVILISPKSIEEIVNAIYNLILNKELRKRIIKNGYALAGENTLKSQAIKLINCINEQMV